VTEYDKEQMEQRQFCRKLQIFAWDVAKRMNSGASSQSVINKIGGLNAADPLAMSVIYFVYTYRHMNKSSGEIGGISYTKCMNNGF
jgi:hypothetical protein